MRKVKLWLALIATLLATVASAQSTVSVTAAEYFFDTDPGYGQGMAINNVVEGEQTVDISTSSLSTGAHTLCLRSLGSNGVWSSTMIKPIYVMNTGSNIQSVEYFFDSDPGYGKGTVLVLDGATDVTIEINTNGIATGAHMLYLRMQDTHGHWSSVMAHPLYVFTVLPVAALEYYIDDNDPGEGNAISVPVATATAATATFDIDTSVLTVGEHTLNIRAMGIDSVWTAVSSRTFTVEGLAEAEPYAVLSEDNTVLTFYYDNQKQTRNGMDIGPFVYETDRDWHNNSNDITRVVFDASFANDATVTSTAYWFYEMRNLTAIEGIQYLNTQNVTDMGYMFSYCGKLRSLDVTGFNTQKVQNMAWMFTRCSSLTSLDVAGFNTQNVTDMTYMFSGCAGLTSLDVSHFNTQNVVWMGGMFGGCYKLESPDVTGFNTQNVTNMSGMFAHCFAMTSLDVTGFDTHNVTDMNAMFHECTGLTSIDVSHFDTQNVTDMRYMFTSCSSLTSLDVTGFNTQNVTGMRHMFSSCSRLTSLDISNFDTQNVTDMGYMFYGCSGLTSLDLSNFNTSKLIYDNNSSYGIYCMFSGCSNLTTIYVGDGWTTTNLTESSDVFNDCVKLVGGKGTGYDANHTDYTYAHIDGGPSNPGYFTDKNATPAIAEAYAVLSDNNTVLTFYYDDKKEQRNGMGVGPFLAYSARGWNEQCESITNVVFDESFANDITLTSTAHWFYGCRNLTTITGISNLRTDNVRYMRYMFRYCTNLTELDVSGFNTENVEDMRGMFSHCSSLTNLNVSRFRTDNVTDMMDMFDDCSKLTTIDVSHFNTEKVTTLSVMFQMCSSLRTLDLSNFNTSNVTNTQGMFYGCSNLVSLDVRNFDMSKVSNEEKNMFIACSSLASIIAGNAEIPAEEYAEIQNPNLLVYVNEPSLAPQGVQNVVVNGVAKEIVLTDEVGANDNNNFFVSQRFTAEKISYTRNFAQETQPNVSRGWESISLPFNVQNIVHETKGDLVPFGSTAEGKKFWLRRLADNGLTRALQIEANVPYVISMPNSTEYTDLYNLSGLVTFSAENTTVPVTTPQVLSLADSSIVMMPTMLRVNRSSSVWALNVGEVRGQYLEGSVFERDYRMVRPFQAYTVHHRVSPAPRFVPLNDLMNGGATGIESLTPALSEGEGAWYTIDGRRLQQKPDQKGVYLHNGRKVVVH